MTYINPNTPALTGTKLLDTKIEDIRVKLASVIWMQKAFGRAWRIPEKKGNTLVYYPMVYQGVGLDYYKATPNDNLKSFCFIYPDDTETVLEYIDRSYRLISRNISIITFFDLLKIDNTKGYKFHDLLKEDILIKLASVSNLVVNTITDTLPKCFDQFSADEIIEPAFLRERYGALRFDCELSYEELCYTLNTYTLT